MTKIAERTTMAPERSVKIPRLLRRLQFALSQPIASLVPRGSGRSHCSHRRERGPLPPGANARRISEPHCRHLMALGVCSMGRNFNFRNQKASVEARAADWRH
jgi:hypothetical protein